MYIYTCIFTKRSRLVFGRWSFPFLRPNIHHGLCYLYATYTEGVYIHKYIMYVYIRTRMVEGNNFHHWFRDFRGILLLSLSNHLSAWVYDKLISSPPFWLTSNCDITSLPRSMDGKPLVSYDFLLDKCNTWNSKTGGVTAISVGTPYLEPAKYYPPWN